MNDPSSERRWLTEIGLLLGLLVIGAVWAIPYELVQDHLTGPPAYWKALLFSAAMAGPPAIFVLLIACVAFFDRPFWLRLGAGLFCSVLLYAVSVWGVALFRPLTPHAVTKSLQILILPLGLLASLAVPLLVRYFTGWRIAPGDDPPKAAQGTILDAVLQGLLLLSALIAALAPAAIRAGFQRELYSRGGDWTAIGLQLGVAVFLSIVWAVPAVWLVLRWKSTPAGVVVLLLLGELQAVAMMLSLLGMVAYGVAPQLPRERIGPGVTFAVAMSTFQAALIAGGLIVLRRLGYRLVSPADGKPLEESPATAPESTGSADGGGSLEE